MKQFTVVLALLCVAAVGRADHHAEGDAAGEMMDAAAMQAMQAAATPGAAHTKLAESVGSYTAQMKFFMGPGTEPMLSSMSVERSMELQGRVLVERWQGNVMGQPFVGHGRTGYDNVTKKFWSTWTDNMSTGVLVMYGDLDEASDTVEFFGDGVNPITGAAYKTRSVGTHPEPGKETMTMYEDHGQGEYKSMSFVLTKN